LESELIREELEISASESDLSSGIWDFCESTRLDEKDSFVENEGFKMVFELSQEIDQLKEELAEYQVNKLTLSNKFKTICS
jgi:hypothetical protein